MTVSGTAAHEQYAAVPPLVAAAVAAASRAGFAGDPRVRVRAGDWRDLADDAPFDLLVLDGGGQGKGQEPPLDPGDWLRAGGVVVLAERASPVLRVPASGSPRRTRPEGVVKVR